MITDALRPLATPIDRLTALEGNPRRGDVRAIVRSLRRFGQRKPVVARRDDGVVIAGNHTLAAARELGWTELAVVFVEDDPAAAKAYALADNHTSALGSFDVADLAAMVADVQAVDPELLTVASFDEDAIAQVNAAAQRDASGAAQALEPSAPEAFPTVDEDLATAYRCPKCHYEWSGKPR